MKCYAVDVDRKYYFCGANLNECESILRTFLKSRRNEDKAYQYNLLFCSSEEVLNECIENQKYTKSKGRYTSLTMRFFCMFNTFPNDDIYFVINSKQDEFYFVPFYTPIREMWSDYNPFQKVDVFEFNSLLELSNHSMTIAGENLSLVNHSWNYVQLNNKRYEILDKINNKEVTSFEDIYNLIYPAFQNYHIFYGEFKNYFLLAHCYLPDDFIKLDQLNMHLQKYRFDIFPTVNVLEFENEKLKNKYYGNMKYVYWDFLDGKISFYIMNEIYDGLFDCYKEMNEEEIRKKMWIDSVSNLYAL